MLQDARIFPGIHGKAMIAVGHIEFPALLVKNKLQFAAFQNHAVVIVEYGN